jgi:deazaflavin-dependent oxidoreductase (nitroreductase family)
MWYNKIMIALLRSPLHGMLGGSMMLITFTGRKSGKTFTTPVNYLRVQDESGEYLLTTSQRDRTWWRNLRGGAPVTLRLNGKDVPARAKAYEDPERVAALLTVLFHKSPQMAKYFKVGLDASGEPLPQDLQRAVSERVVISTVLQ